MPKEDGLAVERDFSHVGVHYDEAPVLAIGLWGCKMRFRRTIELKQN